MGSLKDVSPSAFNTATASRSVSNPMNGQYPSQVAGRSQQAVDGAYNQPDFSKPPGTLHQQFGMATPQPADQGGGFLTALNASPSGRQLAAPDQRQQPNVESSPFAPTVQQRPQAPTGGANFNPQVPGVQLAPQQPLGPGANPAAQVGGGPAPAFSTAPGYTGGYQYAYQSQFPGLNFDKYAPGTTFQNLIDQGVLSQDQVMNAFGYNQNSLDNPDRRAQYAAYAQDINSNNQGGTSRYTQGSQPLSWEDWNRQNSIFGSQVGAMTPNDQNAFQQAQGQFVQQGQAAQQAQQDQLNNPANQRYLIGGLLYDGQGNVMDPNQQQQQQSQGQGYGTGLYVPQLTFGGRY